MHKCVCSSCKQACACLIMSVHLCTNLDEFFFLVICYYLVSLSLKFYKDPSFCCGDICKTILKFVYSLIFYLFCIFSKFDHQSSPKILRYIKLSWTFEDTISKCPLEKYTFPSLRLYPYPGPSAELKLLVNHYGTPCIIH